MGVFSSVWRLQVSGPGAPATAVAKLPIDGPNGDAARLSGAYDRELIAYRGILGAVNSSEPVSSKQVSSKHRLPSTPRMYASLDDGALLLEDLGHLRFVDQLVGLDAQDVLAAIDALHRLHNRFSQAHEFGRQALGELDVRRSAPSKFDPAQLQAGLNAIAGIVSSERHTSLVHLLANREALVEAFDSLPATLCHGDPRADNLAFDRAGQAVLFDWQQLAIQHGEADLAWLAATSIGAERRRHLDQQIVDRYAQLTGEPGETVYLRYRLGLLLPGLAVLLLAQRTQAHDRQAELVSTSIDRISRAVEELDVVGAIRT